MHFFLNPDICAPQGAVINSFFNGIGAFAVHTEYLTRRLFLFAFLVHFCFYFRMLFWV